MFRAFCKISLRFINPETSSSILTSNSKILELKNIIIQDPLPPAHPLHPLKRQVLLQAQLAHDQRNPPLPVRAPFKNGVSPVLEVFEYSLAIFVVLLS